MADEAEDTQTPRSSDDEDESQRRERDIAPSQKLQPDPYRSSGFGPTPGCLVVTGMMITMLAASVGGVVPIVCSRTSRIIGLNDRIESP